MTLDERIKSFKRTFPRPTEWDSAWKVVIRLAHDLIDDREDLKTLLDRKTKIIEEDKRLPLYRVPG